MVSVFLQCDMWCMNEIQIWTKIEEKIVFNTRNTWEMKLICKIVLTMVQTFMWHGKLLFFLRIKYKLIIDKQIEMNKKKNNEILSIVQSNNNRFTFMQTFCSLVSFAWQKFSIRCHSSNTFMCIPLRTLIVCRFFCCWKAMNAVSMMFNGLRQTNLDQVVFCIYR